MEITGAKGKTHNFEPTDILLLLGPRPGDELPCFYITGIVQVPIKVLSDLAEFMNALPNKDKFVQLTLARNGANFWVNAEMVAGVREPNPNNQVLHPSAQSILRLKKGNKPTIAINQDITTTKGALNSTGVNIS
jgi:hypothetical protein